MKRIIVDVETDGLQWTKCWVVVTRDLDTDEVKTFRSIHNAGLAREELRKHLAGCDRIIGHNIVSFDHGVLQYFDCLLDVPQAAFCDTLIVSRLLDYNRVGGHSLEAWGTFFKQPKSTFSDYSKWSMELEERCIQDTLLTKRLYIYFKKYIESTRWKKPIELEHRVAFLCNTLSSNGFTLDYPLALSLFNEISTKVNILKDNLQVAFPPRSKLIKVVCPSLTKTGTLHAKDFKWLQTKDLSPYTPEAPFSLFEYEPFNPSSPTQVVARLNEAGWKPTEKTKGHIEAERSQDKDALQKYKETGWKVCEENLATLPEDAPEAARKLTEYLLLSSRLSMLEQWINLYRPTTNRIHGVFNGIGSWTHRKSHQAPNMANIPSLVNRHGKPQPYGAEFRSLFTVPKDRILVGCDAEGIQLRLFAHYCNDPKLIEAIVNGKKEEKSDIHSLNKAILGTICNSREVAKTYIYALFLGAKMRKQAEILSCTPRQALEGLERILDFYPGWKKLKDTRLAQDARKGYFEGLDGRLVIFPSAHHILAGYLQNGESVVMKMASLLWNDELTSKGVPFTFVNDVHDEWQTETLPEFADVVGQVQAKAIMLVGEQLGLNCPLAGKYVIGSNWRQTH